MALQMSRQCSAKISPSSSSSSSSSTSPSGGKFKRETLPHHKCRSPTFSRNTPQPENVKHQDYMVEPQPDQDNASHCEPVNHQCNGNRINCKSNKAADGGGDGGKQDKNRRRLARGPRSGGGGVVTRERMQSMYLVPSEDHRVVSTDYQQQVSGTQVQVLMRVTLLAAGFVIGARGNSARLIGQATGALVQSWTETDCTTSDALAIRLFRIQGKKGVVQAAVHLIHQAVAKYRDLCECKRRGEFVQREHIINGVEFYYQPPPKKAFSLPRRNNNSNDIIPLEKPATNTIPLSPHSHESNAYNINHSNPHISCYSNKQCLPFSGNHAWSMPQLHSPSLCTCTCSCRFKHQICSFNSYDAAAFHSRLLSSRGDENLALNINFRYPWPGIFHCQGPDAQAQGDEEFPKSMNSHHNNKPAAADAAGEVLCLEEKLEKLGMEGENKKIVVDPVKEREEEMSFSLFSYFGYRGLPLPVPVEQVDNPGPFDFNDSSSL